MHLRCLKFMTRLYILMKCAFCMTSYSQSCVTIMWGLNRILIFLYKFRYLTLFPIIGEALEAELRRASLFHYSSPPSIFCSWRMPAISNSSPVSSESMADRLFSVS